MREHAAEGPAPEATEDVVTTLAPQFRQVARK